MQLHILLILTLITSLQTIVSHERNNEVNDCDLPINLKKEIASYAPTVKSIINATINGDFKGFTYDELAIFVDKFGSRKTGSQNLENSIDYMMNLSRSYGLTEVYGEDVEVPNWIRGEESATLVEPRKQNLNMLGLGYSVGTPPEGILAEVLVVKSFEELIQQAAFAKGKIIVYNQEWTTYGESVAYRSRGASEAAKVGGVASLIRSVTPYSLDTPHTGMQTYAKNVTQIPTACITVEDAHMLERMQKRGETLKILLKMEAKMLPTEISRNTIIDLKGTTNPEKLVIVSGHIDSWDVGNGAMDDGGGAFISWAAVALLKKLGLTPKRTVRAILWTGEEFGLIGAKAYDKAHANETDNINFIMESDIGTFNPLGLEYSAGPVGGCILEEVMRLLEPINATQAVNSSDVGSDITIWTGNGIPGGSLYTENDRYFWYHHSNADTLDVEDSGALNKATALWATVAYVLADLSIDFPREMPPRPRTRH